MSFKKKTQTNFISEYLEKMPSIRKQNPTAHLKLRWGVVVWIQTVLRKEWVGLIWLKYIIGLYEILTGLIWNIMYTHISHIYNDQAELIAQMQKWFVFPFLKFWGKYGYLQKGWNASTKFRDHLCLKYFVKQKNMIFLINRIHLLKP